MRPEIAAKVEAARARHAARQATADRGASRRGGRPPLDVSNAMVTADWLRRNLGIGRLAGMFARGSELVHTPREGESGYVPLTDRDDNIDGPAQVRPIRPGALASRLSYMYRCHRPTKSGPEPAMFPTPAAKVACDTLDMLPNLRRLRGVVHSPILRADGTILDEPGYDPATCLFYIPEPGLTVPPVPETPSDTDVAAAVGLLDEMVADFRWVTPHDKTNYFGALLTPLLREVVPPPYKLVAIGAPQPGSGKSLLADILRTLHGGVFRSEVPEDKAEMRKAITSILAVTTGAVVQFDNVSGVLRSSTLAGLLTSARWDDRPLGATDNVTCTNDRLWTITGNNVKLGGDLVRRTVWVTIDPGVPHPELRTDFTIPNLELWVRGRRGELLAALLTLARAWIVAGQPTERRSGDGFARWTETVDGILATAGVPGMFAHAESARQALGEDDDDWRDFVEAARREFDDRTWLVSDLLERVETSSAPVNGWGQAREPRGISLDDLPGDLGERIVRAGGRTEVVAKSLGRWLGFRDGRWAGDLTVRQRGKEHGVARWQIVTTGETTKV